MTAIPHRAPLRATTVLGVKKGNRVAMGADGQVTLGETIMKEKARKVRLMHNDTVLAGFAGAAADAFTLFEKFEKSLDQYRGNLYRAAVELAKEWRMDKVLRRLESLLIVADRERMLMVSGGGDVIEPEEGVAAIGSGGPYALSAARALAAHTKMAAKEIVSESLGIAARLCIYTNDQIHVEEL